MSEEDVRRIIREELKTFSESVQKSTYGSGDGDLEYAAFQAISSAMEREAHLLPHTWDCQLRSKDFKLYPFKCTCVVEKDS